MFGEEERGANPSTGNVYVVTMRSGWKRSIVALNLSQLATHLNQYSCSESDVEKIEVMMNDE